MWRDAGILTSHPCTCRRTLGVAGGLACGSVGWTVGREGVVTDLDPAREGEVSWGAPLSWEGGLN